MSHDLMDKEVLLVTGKGGTGKSTVSVALALLAARQGKRVLLAEIDMTRPATLTSFGRAPSFQPTGLSDRIDGVNITFFEALHLYLSETISINLVVSRILKNKIVRRFLYSTPFAREVVFLNAIYHFHRHAAEHHHDLVVVDLPATGHAVPLLSVSRNVFRLFNKGPLLRRARQLHAFLSDQRLVSVLFVSLAEEMSVTETIEAYLKLREAVPVAFGPVVVNRLPVSFLAAEDVPVVSRYLEALGSGATERVRYALDLSLSRRRVFERSVNQVRRLEKTLGGPVVRVRELVESEGPEVARGVSDLLEQAL